MSDDSRETSSQKVNETTFNSLSTACFGVAGIAFVGSVGCAAINHSLSGWMAVAGMAGLGLFYLALGVLNLGHTSKSAAEQDANLSTTTPFSAQENGKRNRTSQTHQDELIEV